MFWKFVWLSYFLCAICLAFSRVEAQELSLADCLKIALDQNPLARAAEEGIIIAQESLGISTAPYYPEFTLNSRYHRFRQHIYLPSFPTPIPAVLGTLPTYVGPENDFDFSISTRYVIYDSGERMARLHEALAMSGSAKEEAERIKQKIALDVSLAFQSLLADQELFESSIVNLSRAENHLKIANERKNVGAVPLIDVLRAKVEVAEHQQKVIEAEGRRRTSLGNLTTAMGLPVDFPIEPNPLPNDYFDLKAIRIQEAFLEAISQRPEVRSAYSQLMAAYSRVQEAKSAFGPKLYADGSLGNRDKQFYPRDKEWIAGVSLEVPIFKGFAPTHTLRKVQAEARQLEANYEQILQLVRQEVWNAFSKLKEAHQGIETRAIQVNDARESLRHARERYEVGAGTISELLDTQAILTNAEANKVEANRKFQSSFFTYLWSQGSLLHNSSSCP